MLPYSPAGFYSSCRHPAFRTVFLSRADLHADYGAVRPQHEVRRKTTVPRTLGRGLSGSARERAGRPERRYEQHEYSHAPISTTVESRPGQTRAAALPCGGGATQTGLIGACDTVHRRREAGCVRRDGGWARALAWAAKACFYSRLPRWPSTAVSRTVDVGNLVGGTLSGGCGSGSPFSSPASCIATLSWSYSGRSIEWPGTRRSACF